LAKVLRGKKSVQSFRTKPLNQNGKKKKRYIIFGRQGPLPSSKFYERQRTDTTAGEVLNPGSSLIGKKPETSLLRKGNN